MIFISGEDDKRQLPVQQLSVASLRVIVGKKKQAEACQNNFQPVILFSH
jgi:hypothetical protein